MKRQALCRQERTPNSQEAREREAGERGGQEELFLEGSWGYAGVSVSQYCGGLEDSMQVWNIGKEGTISN